MEPRSGRKWSCEYCTYENFPASKKCTLCRAPRPLQYISDDEPGMGAPSRDAQCDIYKMAELVGCGSDPPSSSSSTSTVVAPICAGGRQAGEKWPCQVCTYLNWPRAARCTQCLTVRPKAVPIIAPSPSRVSDTIQPLSINVNTEGGAMAGSHRNSPRTSPSSPEAAKAANNDRNRAVVALASGKWVCRVCTYENWPKNNKCVMCGVTRSKASSGRSSPRAGSTSPHSGGSPSPDNPSNILDNRTASSQAAQQHRTSPPLLPINTNMGGLETSHCASEGAMASPFILPEKGSSDASRSEHKLRASGERRLRAVRNRLREMDWLWLSACKGVVEGDAHPVEAYLASGGDPARQLRQDECTFLSRPSAFQPGHTLVHLAIRFQREDMLAVLLTSGDVASKARKRVPSHVSPDLASDILRLVSASLRQRKGDFPCYFLTEMATFALPADIDDLPQQVQKKLFDELLDRDVQKELEVEEPIMNWSVELTERLGSRLYALWNRASGDCLLDSVLQATWGVFDRDNTLRRALGDSLNEGSTLFYARWKEVETLQAQSLHFTLDDNQWQQDWAILLSLASQPGASLEQVHIFALAHILRRPIIVYGIKFVKSFRGENIGLARFQGVYLPLMWESSFCWKTPIALGYTRGHFSALIPVETDNDERIGAGANLDSNQETQVAYLPLMDNEGKLLPIHFLTASQMGRDETILREWLDVRITEGGLQVALQHLTRRPLVVRQMVDEWLDRYRRIAAVMDAREQHSTDEETDDE